MTINKDDVLAVFISNYAKRILEDTYNRFGQSRFAKTLQEQSPTVKYGLEAGLYSLAAFLDQKIAKDTILKKAFVEVATDAAPELAKRIINGAKARIKETGELEGQTQLASLVLELSDDSLKRLLTSLFELDPVKRAETLKHLASLASEEQLRLAQLPMEVIQQHVEIFGNQIRKSKPEKSELPPAPPGPEQRPSTVEILTARIREKRKNLESKKKRGVLW